MRKVIFASLIIISRAAAALAVGPHQTALIVNSASSDSVKIAREYAALRSIPQINIVALESLPEKYNLTITPSDFKDKIWIPANNEIGKRGLKDQILAWVYSAGFPTTVSTDPATSLTGMTFLRGEIPANKDLINKALYASPLFADQMRAGARPHRSRSFDRLKAIYRRDMPMPAFLLAHTGERGTTYPEALKYLRRSVSADFSSPTGRIYFVKTSDIRSNAREWQFQPVSQELKQFKVLPSVTNSLPEGATDILGAITGTAHIEPAKMGTFLPGAFADHLTSFGAKFDTKDQTKCTAWLTAGAAGSAGTVVEPFSAWPKFPHARIFVHYISGCTLIESFYQSVRSPLQILPIGDPLCQPWAKRPEITFTGLPVNPVTQTMECSAEAVYQNPLTSADLEWYIDGKLLGKGDSITLVPSSLSAGKHSLRVVALTTGSIRSQAFVLKEFTVAPE